MSDASPHFNWASARARLEKTQQSIDAKVTHSEDELRRILERRAAALATPPVATAANAGSEIVVVRLGAERYGIPLSDVRETIASPKIAPAPGTPPGIRGLLQVRGEVRVVWNLSQLLGAAAGSGSSNFVLLVRHGSNNYAIAVDHVEDVRFVNEAERLRASAGVRSSTWMTADFVSVLDTAALFAATAEET